MYLHVDWRGQSTLNSFHITDQSPINFHFFQRSASFRTKNRTRCMERNCNENTQEMIEKSKSWKPKRVWTILWPEKLIISQFTKNLVGQEFKLKFFDWILDICQSKCNEAVQKDIEDGGLDCTSGIANKILKSFDLFKEGIEKFEGKLGISNLKQHLILRKIWTIYYD